jgi:hypothetical protein
MPEILFLAVKRIFGTRETDLSANKELGSFLHVHPSAPLPFPLAGALLMFESPFKASFSLNPQVDEV